VTHNDCRRQPLVFKEVKTFLAPPNLTVPPKARSGSATVHKTGLMKPWSNLGLLFCLT